MNEEKMTLPIIALRGMTVLPGMLIHFDINREITIKAVKAAMASDQKVLVVTQVEDSIEEPNKASLYRIGTVCMIKQLAKLSDKVMRVMITSEIRASFDDLVQQKPYLIGTVTILTDHSEESLKENEKQAMIRGLKELFELYCIENPRVGNNALQRILDEEDFVHLVDLVAMHISISEKQRQKILDCVKTTDRYSLVSFLLSNEIEVLRIKKSFQEKVKEHVDKNQKDYLLREQMKVIQDELGETNTVTDAEKYFERVTELNASEEVKDKIREEIKRFKSLSQNGSESSVSRGYIETLLELPWDHVTEEYDNLDHARKILDEDHYGLTKVKDRILEFLAVRSLTGKGESPIICLVGPPGTGKTSIAKSIAKALKKEYVRICLGGVRDEAEIRGHRRTYIGAMPGRIINGLKSAKVKNPLMLLDEIDKISSDYKGDTSSALLEVLDSEQNGHFVDHYVEVPVDLSEVLFLCTANTLETIPRPLLDRMEIIELSGYTSNEKFHIAKNHLVGKQKEKNGLEKKQLGITDKALHEIILSYTREAGVRSLERQIGKICRKTAKEIVSDSAEKIRVNGKNLEEYLGKPKFSLNEANQKDEVGIVRGLAWTSVGGETLEVEVTVMPGSGECECTGQLGDVMKESVKIALTYVRSVSEKYGIAEDFYEKHDIHVHVPEGAVPKDGPSAGVTMATAILSAVTNKKVRADVAMTGEVTLRGRVLPIGGLKEKLLAAKAAGIKLVIVPVKNVKDIEELEDEIVEGLDLEYAETMEDVLKNALK